MVCFQTKNPNFGKFWRALDWKIFTYFIATSNILWRFRVFYDHLVNFVFIWCIFSGFGIMYHVPRKIWQPWYKRPTLYHKLNFPAQIFHGTVFYTFIVRGHSDLRHFYPHFQCLILLVVFKLSMVFFLHQNGFQSECRFFCNL
jgi:hypothetical protein